MKRIILPNHPGFRRTVKYLGILMVALGFLTLAFYQFWMKPNTHFHKRFDEFLEMPIEKQRSLCHRLLLRSGGLHDVYIALIQIGNESSVPHLIRSLRWAPKPQDGEWMECTWGHCSDALSKITNFRFGVDQKSWKQWWKKYRNYPRSQWIWDGFVARGYRLNEKDNKTTILTLIEAAADDLPYSDENAHFLMKALFQDSEIEEVLNIASESEADKVRQGSVMILALRNQADDLRQFINDPNVSIGEMARTKMEALLLPSKRYRVLFKQNLGSYIGKIGINKKNQMLYIGRETKTMMGEGSQLVAFSLAKNQIIWTFPCDDVVTSVPQVDQGRIYFVCGNRTIYCLKEGSGEPLWGVAIMPAPPRMRRDNTVILKDDRIFLSAGKDFLCIDRTDGEILWKVSIDPTSSGFVWNEQAIFIHALNEELLALSYDGEIIHKVKAGFPYGELALEGDTLYYWSEVKNATRFENMNIVACDVATFTTKWATGVGGIRNYGNGSPLIASDMIIVSSDTHIAAISKIDGKIRWKVPDEADTEIVHYNENLLVMRTCYSRIALRDVDIGEMVFRMDEPAVFSVPLVHFPNIIFGDMDGNLWIVDPNIHEQAANKQLR